MPTSDQIAFIKNLRYFVLGFACGFGLLLLYQHISPDRLGNIRSATERHTSNVMFVVGIDPTTDKTSLFSCNVPMDRNKRLTDKQEVHVLTVHDREAALNVVNFIFTCLEYFGRKDDLGFRDAQLQMLGPVK